MGRARRHCKGRVAGGRVGGILQHCRALQQGHRSGCVEHHLLARRLCRGRRCCLVACYRPDTGRGGALRRAVGRSCRHLCGGNGGLYPGVQADLGRQCGADLVGGAGSCRGAWLVDFRPAHDCRVHACLCQRSGRHRDHCPGVFRRIGPEWRSSGAVDDADDGVDHDHLSAVARHAGHTADRRGIASAAAVRLGTR